MRFVFDHDLHIHSNLSLCSNEPKQTANNILQYAKEQNLGTICVTDHMWDETVEGWSPCGGYDVQNFAHVSKIKPLPQSDDVRFLFGCETELNQHLTLGISKELCQQMDFVIVPTTHMHFVGFTISQQEAATAKTRADSWVKRLDCVLNKDLPFHKIGLAHLTCSLIAPKRDVFLDTLHCISDDDMWRLFTKAAQLGVGIELNAFDMAFDQSEADTVLRPYHIAKDCGCKFYCGTDAHRPEEFAHTKYFDRAIDLLGLEEKDKFRV